MKNNKKQTDNSFVAVFSTNNNNSGWYVDSGAAMHMTMNKDWIYDETPPPIKTIRVANDKELRVESCGKVNIHVKSKNGSTNSIQRLGHLNYNDMKKLKDHTDGVTMPQNSELTCHALKETGKTSTPYTPQQNGLSERMNRTLLEKARCMLINANLQKSLWAEAIRTAAYITNRTPTRALNYKTPEEYGVAVNLT
ncbi:Retrovirus-related Pol polyprotein from transposon TNT 1-94 [Eumeta japonica]|uniref:Retrovirus-related Pol polyprotein from transposon TNT 1-94 n=1 Tax=Eumeta variegata TaxID=151549 RepID=A0A4C1T0Z8_EUMVA|nr:Retrovirus-related Pol polyprotein from transposon TNT 1-94 [Eumeta japonica]